MRDDRLKKGFVRNPGRAEKAHHIGAARDEGQDRLDGPAAQAPPLAADADLQTLWQGARQAQPTLQVQRGIEQPLALAFVEPVAIDQPFFPKAGLDPVGPEVHRLDMVGLFGLQPGADMFGRLDRQTVARHQVEMRRTGKGGQRRARGL